MPTTLSVRLKSLRQQRKLTQVQLAARAGVRRATISDWEAGKVETMDFGTLARVCGALGIEVNDLLLLPHRTSQRAVEQWQSAEDLAPPETADEALEQFERHAAEWRRILTDLAAKDPEDAHDAGWGMPPARGKRVSIKREQRDLEQAERSGTEGYVDQVLIECTLARRAIKQNDASAAVLHALRAGHAHGSARTMMTKYQKPRRKR